MTGEGKCSGKVVVVSGASTGVGRALAKRFAEDGATVVMFARRKDRLDDAAAEIGEQAIPIPTDITSSASVRAAFEEIAHRFERVDVLVNMAGVTRVRHIEEASDDDIAISVGTNLIGPMYTIRSAVPLLKAAGGGDIVNVSSEITLDRIANLREMRSTLMPTGNVPASLQVMARYVLAELNKEQELFRVLVIEARIRPDLLTDALGRPFGSTFDDFAEWLREQAGDHLDPARARPLAAIGLGSLMWFRLQPILFGVATPGLDDEQFVAGWVDTMLAAIGKHRRAD